MSILSLVRSGNGFASGRLSYVQASTYRPRTTYFLTVLVFVCLYVCATLEGISLEHFSASQKADIKSSTISLQRHAVFNSFLSDDSKQDTSTTTSHSKQLISLPKNKKVLTTSLSTIWENTDGRAEKYICASVLYLISVVSQCYSIIIY